MVLLSMILALVDVVRVLGHGEENKIIEDVN